MKEQNYIKSFETTLKEKAGNFELQPSEKVWAGVKDSLSKERKNRWITTWGIALIGLVLLGSSGIIYYLAFDHTKNIDRLLLDNLKQASQQQTAAGNPASGILDGTFSNKDVIEIKRKGVTGISDFLNVSNQDKSNGMNRPHSTVDSETYPEQVYAMSLASANRMQFKPMDVVRTISTKFPVPLMPETLALSKNQSAGFCYLSCNNIDWVVESFISPMISYRSFTGLPGLAIPDSIATFRNETDKSRLGIKAGAAIMAQFTERFSFGISGSYLSFSEEMMITSQSYIDNTTTGYNTNLPTLGQNNLVNVAETVPGDGEYVTNQFRFFEVAFNANIEMMGFGRHQLESNFGIGYAKLNQIISPYYDSEPVVSPSAVEDLFMSELTEQSSDFRKHHVTTSAGIRYRMDLTEHLGCFGGVQLQYLATNLFVRDYDYVQHPFGLGLNTGLRWQF